MTEVFSQISLTFLPANLWLNRKMEVEIRNVAHWSQVFTNQGHETKAPEHGPSACFRASLGLEVKGKLQGAPQILDILSSWGRSFWHPRKALWGSSLKVSGWHSLSTLESHPGARSKQTAGAQGPCYIEGTFTRLYGFVLWDSHGTLHCK